MNENIDILRHTEKTYKPLVTFEQWRVAGLNHFSIVDLDNLNRVERHLLTDEVFILTTGLAVIIVAKGDSGETYDAFDTITMEQNIVYNVKKGVWHHIVLEKDSSVVIFENSDTGLNNTEYKTLNAHEIERIKRVIRERIRTDKSGA